MGLQSLPILPLAGVFLVAACVILLAIATDLPEIAITVTAAAEGKVGVAVGSILGGIAIVAVLIVSVMGTQLPAGSSMRGSSQPRCSSPSSR